MNARSSALSPEAEALVRDEFCGGEEEVFGLLERAVGAKYLAAYHSASAGKPGTLQSSFNRDKANYYGQRLEFLGHWLKASCEENFSWLERRYDNGWPKKLQKNPAKALKDAGKWLHRENSLHNPIPEPVRQLYNTLFERTIRPEIFGNFSETRIHCSKATEEFFDKNLPFSVTEFVDTQLAGLNGAHNVYLKIENTDDSIGATVKVHVDSSQFNGGVAYDLGRKCVADIGGSANRQKHGIFKQLFLNHLSVCERLGIEKMNISAGFIGQYAWARYGYVPNDNSWQGIKSELSKILSDYQGRISDNSYRQIEAALESDNPKAIWLIADQREKIDGYPIGFHLLTKGPSWHGALDLTDPDCLSRCKAYIGLSDRPKSSHPLMRTDNQNPFPPARL